MSETTQPAAVVDGVDHRGIARRSRRWGWWYVCEHRVRSMRSYVASWFGLSIGEPFLFVMGLGLGLALLVDQNQESGVDGVPYLVFIVPALMMASAMQTSANENTWGVFGGFKWFPMFFAMNGTPISAAQIVLGYQLATLVRVALPLLTFTAMILILQLGDPLGALLLLPIGLLLAASVGFSVMAWVATQTQDRGQLSFIERFVVLPLTLFSGTYFPLETLPWFLHWIGWISPLWHAAELGRSALYGAELSPLMALVHVGFLVLLAAVTCVLSIRVFQKRLDT